MTSLQKHTRCSYYHLPIHCGYCGHRIMTGEGDAEPMLEPCPHTLYIAFSEGIEYLADRVIAQLREKGYDVPESESDGLIEIYSDNVEDPDVHPEELADILEFGDGIVIEAVVGPPSGMSGYVAYAPLENEGYEE